MSASHASPASIATPTGQTGPRDEPGVAFSADEVSGARLLFVDVRMRSLLMHEGRERVVTRMFGLGRDEQSFLVTMILIGALGTVIRDFAAPLWPRPSGADAAIGGSVLNTTLRGLAGPPSRNVPLAAAMIACAMLSHSLRPAVAGSAREIGALFGGVRAAFGGRYGH